MNRTEKTTYISSLKKDLENNNAMMVYHYEGLNVNQLDDLRDQMRQVGALLKVTKNRIKGVPDMSIFPDKYNPAAMTNIKPESAKRYLESIFISLSSLYL